MTADFEWLYPLRFFATAALWIFAPMRPLISPDFQSVSLRRVTWIGLIVSSPAFGLLNGGRCFAGTLAGILYGLVLVRRGRIGDAVVAHATTNALLAAYVLIFHQRRLW